MLAWVAGLAAVLLAAASIPWLLRRQLDHRMARKDYRAAARTAAILGRIPVAGRPAPVAGAIAHMKLGNPERALKQLQPQGRDATHDYLRATAYAMQGHDGQAQDALAECLAFQPGFLHDARLNPHLRPVLERALARAHSRRAQDAAYA